MIDAGGGAGRGRGRRTEWWIGGRSGGGANVANRFPLLSHHPSHSTPPLFPPPPLATNFRNTHICYDDRSPPPLQIDVTAGGGDAGRWAVKCLPEQGVGGADRPMHCSAHCPLPRPRTLKGRGRAGGTDSQPQCADKNRVGNRDGRGEGESSLGAACLVGQGRQLVFE